MIYYLVTFVGTMSNSTLSIPTGTKRNRVLISLLLVTILLSPLVSSNSIGFSASHQEHRSSAHSYSNSLSSAYDGSNSTYAFIVVRGCDNGACTQESYYDVDYTLSPASSPDRLEFEWNIPVSYTHLTLPTNC